MGLKEEFLIAREWIENEFKFDWMNIVSFKTGFYIKIKIIFSQENYLSSNAIFDIWAGFYRFIS